jgi:hypothetical protein
MKSVTGMLKGSPLYQLKGISPVGQMQRLGDSVMTTEMAFNPTQREVNQMNTMNQVQNYANTKMMAEQGRTDMRGNVIGYADTLG